jgi:hypothetical protein
MDFYTWFELMVCKGELRREDQAVAELAWQQALASVRDAFVELEDQGDIDENCLNEVIEILAGIE